MNIRNKKLHLDYEVTDTYQAGIELLGHEIKSLRAGHASLDGARVIIRGGEAYIVGLQIRPYQAENKSSTQKSGSMPGSAIDRTRRLLLKKSEILKLTTMDRQGITLLPLSIYDFHNRIKVDIVLAKRLKKWDKREVLKKKWD